MKKTNFTLEQSIIYTALFFTSSDGNISTAEANYIENNSFLSKNWQNGDLDRFFDLLDEDFFNTYFKSGVITSQIGKKDFEFKKAFIKSILGVIVSDGEVHDNEFLLLIILRENIGVSETELSLIIDEFNNSL